ncbi:hypothetical protein Deipe_0778 [Deinococcus peraridilitoris DSM 19664]|uniref:Alpha-galactosidase n=1 Tax=Deinococcus peraridilitoris (strain DSM 19664 / LMG 22246 / CIP 109416 / KR-200) TaxID=937777 RepID=K9ZYS4_DEIPD|nr:hypothetical protein Deipe_0778 [Deinococcus peraridilitoris DSM 19664]
MISSARPQPQAHHRVAVTPPMGWNSWDCYGASVTELEVLGNAQYLAEHLKPFGWEYVVVDIQWYEPEANSSVYRPFVPLEMDAYSRLMPSTRRFPSAADGAGFKPLADELHRLGLKFGIHIMRGIPRQAVHANTPILGTNARARDIAHPNSICPWNTDMYGVDATKEGAQAYYDSLFPLFQLYASWGVDFVKVDDIAASRLYHFHPAEIELIRRAIDRCGREMVLSLSPGPAPVEHAQFLVDHANMWRLTDDYWDHWDMLYAMFERCDAWSAYVGSGHWPDCDMLPLGRIGLRSVDGGGRDRLTRFTPDEQRTMMTLWCLFRSPLMFGGELRDNDEATLALLTNMDVLAVHRHGERPRQLCREGDLVVWTSDMPDGQVNLGLFNLYDRAETIVFPLAELGLHGTLHASDLWVGQPMNVERDVLSVHLEPHASCLVQISGDP